MTAGLLFYFNKNLKNPSEGTQVLWTFMYQFNILILYKQASKS